MTGYTVLAYAITNDMEYEFSWVCRTKDAAKKILAAQLDADDIDSVSISASNFDDQADLKREQRKSELDNLANTTAQSEATQESAA